MFNVTQLSFSPTSGHLFGNMVSVLDAWATQSNNPMLSHGPDLWPALQQTTHIKASGPLRGRYAYDLLAQHYETQKETPQGLY